jgi:hypothetical protein
VAKAVVTDEVDHRSHEMSRSLALLAQKKIKKKCGKKMQAGMLEKRGPVSGKRGSLHWPETSWLTENRRLRT